MSQFVVEVVDDVNAVEMDAVAVEAVVVDVVVVVGGVNMDADVDKLWNVKASKEQKLEKQKQKLEEKGSTKTPQMVIQIRSLFQLIPNS